MDQGLRRRIGEWKRGIATIMLILIGWEIAALAIQNNYIIPPITDIILVLLYPNMPVLGGLSLLENTYVSLREVIYGFVIAAAIAIPLGLLIGMSATIRSYLNPVIQILRPVPPIAWMPFAIAWFGIGLSSILFIIILGAFFPILINTVDGVNRIRKRWLDVAKMLHATRYETIRSVVIPGTLPSVLTGLRVSFGVAWMCVVAAEMLPGASAGLGFLIMYAYNLGQLAVIGAGMVMIGIIGLGADTLFQAARARFFSWEVEA